MLIVVNESSNSGKGAKRWRAVDAALRERGMTYHAVCTTSAEHGAEVVHRAIDEGERVIVAAGGDGTTNSVLDALFDPDTDRIRGDVTLGAIGLGSSNDFHKPFVDERCVAGCPARIDADAPERVDVGRARLETPDGHVHTRYFLLNASLGVVAEGNAFFNTEDRLLVWLKRRSVDLAIVYAALVALARSEPLEVGIRLDDGPEEAVTCVAMGILKKVHFAGDMYYDTPVTADDGMFDVNIWGAMSRFATLRQILALYGGKFTGRPHCTTHRARTVHLTPSEPTHFELDGEVTRVRRVELDVLPRTLSLCG